MTAQSVTVTGHPGTAARWPDSRVSVAVAGAVVLDLTAAEARLLTARLEAEAAQALRAAR